MFRFQALVRVSSQSGLSPSLHQYVRRCAYTLVTHRASSLPQVGLNYICQTAERFFAVGAVLGNMVVSQAQAQEQPSQRLLKHIIRCYLRLSDNPR